MPADRSEDAWRRLCKSGTRRPAEMLDIFGCWPKESGRDWTARPTYDDVVEFTEVGTPLARLVEDLERQHRLSERVGEFELMRELIRQAALAKLSDWKEPRPWAEVAAALAGQMTRAVVAVPIGGVYSPVTDGAGSARPLVLGRTAVAGHLDITLEEAIDALAKRQGLVGFRFSAESWWTEELMIAKEDPVIGQELLDDYEQGDSWPWFPRRSGSQVRAHVWDARALAPRGKQARAQRRRVRLRPERAPGRWSCPGSTPGRAREGRPEDVQVSIEGAGALGIVVGAESLIDNQPDHRIVSAVASHLQSGQASAARLPPER